LSLRQLFWVSDLQPISFKPVLGQDEQQLGIKICPSSQVRALKERRGCLQERLDKFTRFGHGSEVPETRIPLPEILSRTLDFAASGWAATPQSSVSSLPMSMKSVLAASSAVMMQVGRCYGHNFLLFSTIFEKNAIFSSIFAKIFIKINTSVSGTSRFLSDLFPSRM
jgi:hypothetical protein